MPAPHWSIFKARCFSWCQPTVPRHWMQTICANLTRFAIYVNRGLIWWQYNMLCSSSFIDDIMFAWLHNHTHNRFTALFPGPPGWAGARRENFWTLWCKGKLTEADTLTIRLGTTIRTNQCPPPPSRPIFFYGPDALLAAQTTVSKHWRQCLHG